MTNILLKAVEFEIKLENLKDFKDFLSEIFYVQGEPWKFKFHKMDHIESGSRSGCDYSSLEVNLQSHRADKSDHWAIAAHFTVKLVSSELHGRIGTAVFHSSCLNWGLSSFIRWEDLLNPENGYTINDTCRIQVKVEVSPLQDINDCLKMECLKRCCDKDASGHFRFTINIVDDFIGIATPHLKLRGLAWRIFISKMNPILDPILRLCLYTNIKTDCREIVKIFTCKLISFDPNVSPVEMKVENLIFSTTSRVYYLDLINWKDFIKSENRFIENRSFVIEIEMEVDHGDDCLVQPQKRGASDGGGNNIELECAICLDSLVGKVISTTKCGHMFCDPCIRQALRRNKTCPICNKKLSLVQLYQTFLPIKKIKNGI